MKAFLYGLLALCVVVGATAGLTFYFNPLWVNDLRIRNHMWRQHVQSKYVQVDGYRVHYYEAVTPDRLLRAGSPKGGVPLVLVHGLGSRGEDWSPMIPTLAASGFHVYVPDLLGYGRSERPDVGYSVSLEEQTVVDYMKVMGVPRADVAGWSMGGWIAMKLTLDHPEMVERLVVYDSAGVYFPPTFDASLFTPTDTPGLMKLSAMLTPHPKPFPGFVARAAIRKLHGSGWVIRRSVTAMTSGKDLLDFRLHEIHKPTLIVWGSDDKLIPLSAGEEMHDRIAGSSLLVIGGCGHLAPGECTRPVLRGTLAFLHADPPMRGGQRVVPGVAAHP
ncbi:alpha/beta fold hydrolase [Granulicella tundricola]|uniref:Alpha/beta hydrolase fold protein n=1 Tax=Granulicella tundricola (strain ATCC BAA-1859 / DSM 23138 / MP5ACTX9) TaxID=1198114 RepID=E8X5F5_GRATM|nr:alpha/beta hydrolase [Granulicella tundricola]ADW69502.1 alpha/beta hydrolase fold protein [Granulicella tundricola MP5ACTX9]